MSRRTETSIIVTSWRKFQSVFNRSTLSNLTIILFNSLLQTLFLNFPHKEFLVCPFLLTLLLSLLIHFIFTAQCLNIDVITPIMSSVINYSYYILMRCGRSSIVFYFLVFTFLEFFCSF